MVIYGIRETYDDGETAYCGLLEDGFSTSEGKTIDACKKIAADWFNLEDDEIDDFSSRNENDEFTITTYASVLTVVQVEVEE